jgi:PilZ domain
MTWLANSQSNDRRNGERHSAPLLVAYYWNGANAIPHGVRDMSASGVYVVTEDRWYPGTLVLITLQKSADDADLRLRRSIGVQSKVVRSGLDGVGFAFVFPNRAYSGRANNFIHGADRTAFAEFSRPFLSTKTA